MSTSVFPSTLKGFDIHITRTAEWATIVQQAMSGKEVRVAKRIYPKRTWALQFNFLRSSTTYLEFQTLEAFFNNRQGMYDSFLFDDQDDDLVTSQSIGIGDSTTAAFQLVRSFGGYAENIYAPNTITSITVGSTIITSTQYSLSVWGSTVPGVVTFTSIPPSGQSIVVNMSYYWPVRFTEDNMSFDKIVSLIWEAKKVTFTSIL